jgi:D-arabinose 1-dehydrogenase-like Zn-dependent alcohol dehydrogenase
VPLPAPIEFVTAASLGCRFATAYRALTAHGKVQADEWVAVHGCGGVGLSAVMIAVALGARVVATDLSSAALARAGELGAEVVLRSGDSVSAHICELTGGGAHVSVDAVGTASTALASVNALRPRGRHVQVGLLFGTDSTPPLPMDRVVSNELEIYGSHGMAASGYPPLLELVASGTVQPERLINKVVGLHEAGSALAAMSQPAIEAGITVVRV